MTKGRTAVLLAVGLVLLVGGLFLAVRRDRPPNLLLITLDTTRADHLGCYGYSDGQTPFLDGLAASGALFEHVYTCAPLTLPAHATILTGLLPPEHALRINGEGALHPNARTLAEILKGRGYRTGAFIASVVLDSRYGLDQGFEVYDDLVYPSNVGEEGLRAYRPGAEVVNASLKWLGAGDDAPFFCWVHLYDPHKPYYEHRDLFGTRFAGRPYDAEVAYMDIQVGRLLDFLRQEGLAKNTLVLAVADHGESLGEHNELYHGNTLYEAALKVPLLIAWPGRVPAGLRSQQAVSAADIFPTVLELMRAGEAKTPSARISAGAAADEADVEPRDCYAETDEPWQQYGWSPLRCVVSDHWKYIRAPRPELYNLSADPQEKANLAVTEPDRAKAMENLLQETENVMVPGEAEEVSLSASDRRVLQSLGYAGGGAPPSSAPGADLADVKDMLPLMNRAMESETLLKRGRVKEALTLREQILQQDPRNVAFQFLLAEAFFEIGKVDAAIQQAEQMLTEEGPRLTTIVTVDCLTLLGKCYSLKGQRQRAVERLREALRLDDSSLVALNGLAWLLATHEPVSVADAEEAVSLAEKVIALGGSANPSFLDTLASACAAAGRFDRAVATAEKAVELATQRSDVRMATEIRERLALYRQQRPYREQAGR